MDLQTFSRLAETLLPHLTEATRSVMSGVSAQQAEDVAQETIMRLWTMRDTLDRVRSVESLSMTIARRLALDYARRARLTPTSSADDYEEAIEAEAEGILRDSDNRLSASAILGSLPPVHALVMRLRHIDGLDNPEIAAMTGMSEGNVRVILCRARTAARNFISSHPKIF